MRRQVIPCFSISWMSDRLLSRSTDPHVCFCVSTMLAWFSWLYGKFWIWVFDNCSIVVFSQDGFGHSGSFILHRLFCKNKKREREKLSAFCLEVESRKISKACFLLWDFLCDHHNPSSWKWWYSSTRNQPLLHKWAVSSHDCKAPSGESIWWEMFRGTWVCYPHPPVKLVFL